MDIHDATIKDDEHLFQLDDLDKFKLKAYKNAKVYNEGTRRCHNKHVLKKEFCEGDMVLLSNLRLKFFLDKFKSKWSDLFKVL